MSYACFWGPYCIEVMSQFYARPEVEFENFNLSEHEISFRINQYW